MRPLHTWLIAGGGLVLLFAAMGWATWSLARMEDTRRRMAAEAVTQERARLALWRMESLALALVVEESARPPEQYRAGANGAVSPLLGRESARVRLYFELDADGRVRSPQAPETEEERRTAERLEIPSDVLDRALAGLGELRALLSEQAPEASRKLVEKREGAAGRRSAGMDNRALLRDWNAPPPARESVSIAAAKEEEPAGDAPVYEPPRVALDLKPGTAWDLQQAMNEKEARLRQSQVAEATRNTVGRGQNYYQEKSELLVARAETPPHSAAPSFVPPEAAMKRSAKAAPPPPERSEVAARPPLDVEPSPEQREEAVPLVAAAKAAERAPAPEPEAETSLESALAAGPSLLTAPEPETAATAPADVALLSAEAEAFQESAPAAAPALAPVLTVSDFRPLWIRDALLLTRRVTDAAGVATVQGAWIDWPALRADLLRAVADLFPSAELEPASPGENGEEDRSRLLASLPVRFLPGALETPAPPFWTPLKLSLAAAWACVLIATAAVAAVLRAMVLLSERRASFVSSVTHELRTPLATFKLYSELLADGLVRDEAKRQRYLETLSAEADRLGHLVENVLSWSRLEGGRGQSCRAPVAPAELCARLEPRLRQRAAQAGAELTIDCSPDAPVFTTDAAAVEQIVFNLVDNACKYGGRGDEPPKVTVEVSRDARGRVVFAVCDQGRGVLKSEVRRLFRPFHKSAREAAHSAPGVGLGLALCRRLATELGGSLEIDCDRREGACFLLKLPA